MAGELSSVMIIASAGLLPDPPGNIGIAIDVNSNLISAVDRYNSIDVVSQFKAVVANSSGNVTGNLLSMSTADFPAINDVLPTGYVAGNLYPAPLYTTFDLYNPGDRVEDASGAVYENILQSTEIAPGNVTYWTEILEPQAYLSDIVTSVAEYLLPVNDASIFCQIFTASQGYVDQTNVILRSVDSSDILAASFAPASGGMDYITTGGLNLVSTDFESLSVDLQNLGSLIDLGNLDSWGFPGEVLAQIGRVSGGEIPKVAQALLDSGITRSEIISLSGGVDTLSATAQRTVYQVMTRISGDALNQVLSVLGVTTPNIRVMSDLLDLRKILPNSFGSLVCPTAAGSAPIFLGATPDAGVNPNLIPVVQNALLEQYTGPNTTTSYNVLSRITPGDMALSNKAFARSLQQIKNVASATLPALSTAISAVENNSGLSQIQNLSVPVPDSVKDFLQQNLAEGTGANGTLLLSDVIGVCAGIGFNDVLDNVSATLESMTSEGAFSNLTSVTGAYSTMANTLAGSYTSFTGSGYETVIPAGRPGEGTYSLYATSALAIEAAMISGVIPGTANIIANIATAYPDQTTVANDNQQLIVDRLERQVNNLLLSEIEINELVSNNRSAAMSFASSLHEFGIDVAPGGANDILQGVANTATLSGQALVSSLREGRNIFALQAAGIELDTQLPS